MSLLTWMWFLQLTLKGKASSQKLLSDQRAHTHTHVGGHCFPPWAVLIPDNTASYSPASEVLLTGPVPTSFHRGLLRPHQLPPAESALIILENWWQNLSEVYVASQGLSVLSQHRVPFPFLSSLSLAPPSSPLGAADKQQAWVRSHYHHTFAMVIF